MVANHKVQGHASCSSPNRVECSIYIPTDLFHRLNDERALTGQTMSFSAFVCEQVKKGLDVSK